MDYEHRFVDGAGEPIVYDPDKNTQVAEYNVTKTEVTFDFDGACILVTFIHYLSPKAGS